MGKSWSTGRIYDKIGDTAAGTVLYVLPKGVLCQINEEDLLDAVNDKGQEADHVSTDENKM